jgi:hypothetical protein
MHMVVTQLVGGWRLFSRRPVALGAPFQETASFAVDRTANATTERDVPAVLTFAIAPAPLVVTPVALCGNSWRAANSRFQRSNHEGACPGLERHSLPGTS